MGVRSVIGWLVVSAFACSSSMEEPPPPAKLEDCVGGWQTLSARQVTSVTMPRTLRWHAGEVFYHQGKEFQSETGPSYVAVPDVGGEPRVVLEEEAGRELWVEGDQLLYATGDRLYSTSVDGGGPAMLVADGGMLGDNTFVSAYALDDVYLYFVTLEAVDSWVVWRVPRAGGPSEQIGRFSQQAPIDALVAAPEGLLAITTLGYAHLFSEDGTNEGAPPAVARARLVGAAASGVLWTAFSVRDGKSVRELWLSKPNASEPERFWPEMPHGLDQLHAWMDERGTWLLAAVEPFSDGEEHWSVWSIDSDGNAEHLGCAPSAMQFGTHLSAGVVSEAGVILAIDPGRGSDGWELVKVER